MSSVSTAAVSTASQMDLKYLSETKRPLRTQADIFRLKVLTELNQLKKELDTLYINYPDALAKKIIDWVEHFKSACKVKDLEAVQSRFIAEMHQLLKDPIGGFLDENALLGSDGLVYSSMSYGIFRATVPSELQNRSPSNPMLPSLFTVKPHRPVEVIIKWLRKYNQVPICQRTQQTYDGLLKEGKIPTTTITRVGSAGSATCDHTFKATTTPPSKSEYTEEKMRKFLAAQATFKKQKDQNIMTLKELEANRKRTYQQIMSGANEQNNGINRFSQNGSQQFRREQAELDRLQKEFRQQNEDVKQRIDQLEQEADKLQKDLDFLKNQQSQVQSGIKNVAEQGSKLAAQIDATRQKIEEINRKSERLKRALTAAAFVGACIFATWALGFALEGTSLGAMIAPTPGGGAFVGGALAF
jgi:hypothetical protein